MFISKENILKFGAHVGHLRKYRHPQMKPYIYDNKKKRVDFFDIRRIIESCIFVSQQIKKMGKKTFLFVGTKTQASEIVKEKAISCNSPYIVSKWPGGLLTNFGETIKKIRNLEYLNSFLQSSNFQSLSQKEKTKLEKKREKINNIYGGISRFKYRSEFPDVLVIIDGNREKKAIEEAKILGIKIISLCSTNSDPNIINYPLFGNNYRTESITIFIDLIAKAIGENRILLTEEKKKEKIIKEKIEPENGSTL